jgi:preprotein translocase subunit SecG
LNIQEIQIMWKLAIGFVIFAAISLFVLMQAGDKADLSGEKHGGDVTHAPAPAAPAAPK